MRQYTDAEVLAYWDDTIGTQVTRKREYIDARNYIIALLYYKFGYVEVELGEIFNIHHSTINHAKKYPYNLMDVNDEIFIENTKELVDKFPYMFPKADDIQPTKLYALTLRLNKADLKRLRAYASSKNRRINQAGSEIVEKYLREWGE
jgi:hypothetical protein